jgi:acyl dehydratase
VTAGRPDVDVDALVALAGGWDLAPLREQVDGPYAEYLRTGDTWTVEDADVVTGATEFARLTLNVAAVHHDRRTTGTGERLVYGGHTIGLAALQASRALPALAMVLAWHRCDHTGPVLEGDDLTSEIALEHLTPLVRGGALVHLRSRVFAHRDGESCGVLDWRYVALIA